MAREKVPTTPEERNIWIMYQLRMNKSSFAKLARQYGVTAQTVRRAIYIKYPKWERRIADVIGLTPSEIWPERYAA